MMPKYFALVFAGQYRIGFLNEDGAYQTVCSLFSPYNNIESAREIAAMLDYGDVVLTEKDEK